MVGDVVDVEVYYGALLKECWYKRETLAEMVFEVAF